MGIWSEGTGPFRHGDGNIVTNDAEKTAAVDKYYCSVLVKMQEDVLISQEDGEVFSSPFLNQQGQRTSTQEF